MGMPQTCKYSVSQKMKKVFLIFLGIYAVVFAKESQHSKWKHDDDVPATTDDDDVMMETEEPTTTTTTLPPVIRLHPHDLILIHREEHVLGVDWDKPEDYKNATLEYEVFYVEGDKDSCQDTVHALGSQSLETNRTEANLTNLETATFYSICVRTVLPEKIGAVFSRVLAVSTGGYGGSGSPCRCELANVADRENPCDHKTGDCYCKKSATQPRCAICERGYYRKKSTRECLKCNCDTDRSDGTCAPQMDGVIECKCKKNYAGRKCESCKQGFYLKQGKCLPCHCSGNSKPNVTDVCDPFSGVCKACWFNTTGEDCEACVEGFEGDAEARTCEPIKAPPRRDDSMTHAEFIMLACLLLGLALSILTATYIYFQLRRDRLASGATKGRARAGVRFSQMQEQDWDDADLLTSPKQHSLSAKDLHDMAASLDGDSGGVTSSSDRRLLLEVNESRPIYRSIKS